MKQFGKILKFELKGYMRNKIFVGITVFLAVAIVIVAFIPNVIAAFSSEGDTDGEVTVSQSSVMLVYSKDETLYDAVIPAFSAAFADYAVKRAEGNAESLKESIVSGDAACGFVLDSITSYVYYVDDLSMYDVNTEIASAVLLEIYRVNAMLEQGISPEHAAEIMSVTVMGGTETLGVDQAQNFLYTYVMIMALYMVILLYGQMVATNVATEKSSRAMEVLVTSADPVSMMFGKVLASCIAGFSQLVAVFGTAIICYNLNREMLSNPIITSLFDIPLYLFVYLIVFFVLGFLIYAFMFGAIGSTASKLEDINTSVMPVTFLFIIAFMVVMFSMSSGSVDNTAMLICSYIPFTSPMAMFTRICMSAVAWYEIAASIGILVVSTALVGVLSAKIYRVGVLLYGTPPKLGAILNTVFKRG